MDRGEWLNEPGRAEAKAGGAVSAELDELFGREFIEDGVGCAVSPKSGKRGIEQSLRRNRFLVEESAAVSRTSLIVDPNVLVDLAGVDREVRKVAIGEQDEPSGCTAEDGIGQETGELLFPIRRKITAHLETIFFEDNGALAGNDNLRAREAVHVCGHFRDFDVPASIASEAAESQRGHSESKCTLGAADREGNEPGFTKTEVACTGIGPFRSFAKELVRVWVFSLFSAWEDMVAQHTLDGTARNHGKPRMPLALNGLVDGADAGSCADVQGSSGEEVEDAGLHGMECG